jgi:hypothetical protein
MRLDAVGSAQHQDDFSKVVCPTMERFDYGEKEEERS